MPTDDSYVPEDEYEERRGWLPWIALILLLAIVVWLYLTYGQHKVAKDDVQVTGAAMVKVPDLVGMDGDAAEAILKQLDLTSERGISYDVLGKPGTVGFQDPDAGKTVKPGTNVFIGIVDISTVSRTSDYKPPTSFTTSVMKSRPPRRISTVTMPKVAGLSEKAATDRLEALGFQVRPMYQPRTEDIGQVLEASYEPGMEVPKGGQVHILIAVAP